LVVPALEDLKTDPAASSRKESSVDDDDKLREENKWLLADGLETEVFPRADTHEEVQAIVTRLQGAKHDLKARLVIGGFTLEPIEHEGSGQACETCMYYKVHRRYCELPEFELPVEPEWSCRLWRI
jgi:hypothetical protein